MGIVDVVSTLTHVPTLLKLKREMVPRPDETNDCLGLRVEASAARLPDHVAMVCEDTEITWSGFNALANRYANCLAADGVGPGDTVSVVMENRIEFLATIVALNKIGAIGALINTNLRGRPLTHCITVTESKKCIVGAELSAAIDEVKGDLPLQEGADYFVLPDSGHGLNTDAPLPNWARDLQAESVNASTDNPSRTGENVIADTALYIYTSGTTGLPKAAVLSNRRYLGAADMSGKAGLKLSPKDRIYLCLPLYHGTGLMVGAGAAFSTGASMFIRRKFSASNFLPEVREHGCTALIYIGELCRYLTNSEAKPDDHKNPIRAMIGNGLRPDVWMNFKNRYGIKRISEFYGASEGNVSFANLMNKDCTVGMTTAEIALVKYDVDEDEIVKDANGFCIPVSDGEPGLMLGKIKSDTVFEGYTDPEATEKKIVRNALEEGDAWFNSGDLMRTTDVGYTLGYPHYQFVDRVGDTFRWKSENVSTNEVGEIINGHPQVKFCNVYGVEIPGADGKAGMAAITLNDEIAELDVENFAAYVQRELPAYAIPVFLRVQEDIDVTGTFKMVKGDLRKEGYDLARVTDPVYVMKNGEKHYSAFADDYLALIRSGSAGY